MRFAVLSSCLILTLSSTALARTWHIIPDGTGDAPTIQAGIDSAAAEDVVELANGTFVGEGNRDIDFLGKAITVRSASAEPDLCIIDCQASMEDLHRGFVFQTGEGSDSRLEGITVTNGFVANEDDPCPDGSGGGIMVTNNSSPTIDRMILLNNTAMYGGGMFSWYGSSPVITNCQFLGNTAETESCWGIGGGLYCCRTESNISDCVFRDNHAGKYGGGLVLQACEIPITVTRCEFYDNWARLGGGGFETYHCDPACELVQCTFARNTTPSNGGGVMVYDSLCILRNCTLVENAGSHWGGGVSASGAGAQVEIQNTIIAFGTQGSAVGCNETDDVTLSCCNLYGNSGGDWYDCAGGLGYMGNISEDPLFCGDNNPEAPFTLRSDSPCAVFSYPCWLIGAWPVGCEPTSEIEPSPAAGSAFVLHPACPNPFNPMTVIQYDLPRSVPVSLRVYDMSGRLVRTILSDEVVQAGRHDTVWNGQDEAGQAVAAGVYFFSLEAGPFFETRRMTLLK